MSDKEDFAGNTQEQDIASVLGHEEGHDLDEALPDQEGGDDCQEGDGEPVATARGLTQTSAPLDESAYREPLQAPVATEEDHGEDQQPEEEAEALAHAQMLKKYPESILAFVSEHVEGEGVSEAFDTLLSGGGLSKFLREAGPASIFACRGLIEGSNIFRQPLPCEVIAIEGATDNDPAEFVLYRRVKGVGESRIAGKCSITWGGHVEQADAVLNHRSSVLNVPATILTAHTREMLEEVDIYHPSRRPIPEGHFIGVINDNSDEVGQCHLALLRLRTVPHGTVVVSREPRSEIVGRFTLEQLKAGLPDVELENWSVITLTALGQFLTDKGAVRKDLIVSRDAHQITQLVVPEA